MTAIGAVSNYRYPVGMPPPRKPIASRARRRTSANIAARNYPNRIAELVTKHDLTYAAVADQINTHEVTIAKLATGKQQLTLDWMRKLAEVFSVRPAEIIEAPPGEGLRVVRVSGAIEAGAWAESHEWPHDEQYDVTVPDDLSLRSADLYAGEIRGHSMNLRYAHGSVVVMSRVPGTSPSEIMEGRRYHVRTTRPDGTTEETIKTLVRGDDGRYWLRPESSKPEFQEWIPIEGKPGTTIELIGRVRFVVQRED